MRSGRGKGVGFPAELKVVVVIVGKVEGIKKIYKFCINTFFA